MKTFGILLVSAVAALLAGCAAPSHTVVSQQVGPDLARPRINAGAGQGRLVVYTATELLDPVAYFPTHGSYAIYKEDGALLRRVDNRSGTFDQEPIAVSLPAGAYKIKGRATNAGEIEATVIVAENKTTIVDLQGATLPQHKPTGAGQWVRLPDGKVIGMRYE